MGNMLKGFKLYEANVILGNSAEGDTLANCDVLDDIQTALNLTPNGGTLFIRKGTYTSDNLLAGTNKKIIGESKLGVVISNVAAKHISGVTLYFENITFSNFSLVQFSSSLYKLKFCKFIHSVEAAFLKQIAADDLELEYCEFTFTTPSVINSNMVTANRGIIKGCTFLGNGTIAKTASAYMITIASIPTNIFANFLTNFKDSSGSISTGIDGSGTIKGNTIKNVELGLSFNGRNNAIGNFIDITDTGISAISAFGGIVSNNIVKNATVAEYSLGGTISAVNNQ